MLNDAKYKSCLTLILASPNTSADSSVNIGGGVDDQSVNGMIPDESAINTSVEMNLNQLSQTMNRTFVRSETFNHSLERTNETIIPIKCLSNDENNDSNQLLNIDTVVTETSPKYCCTLEVKFVWYGNGAKNIGTYSFEILKNRNKKSIQH